MSETAPQSASGAPFMRAERETLERFAPSLLSFLEGHSLLELEEPGNGAIQAFRESGAPALLVPRERGGKGATPLELVRLHRAIASRSPSLAIATTMHHFSLATLVEYCATASEVEWLLIEGLAAENMLLASGVAEGRSRQPMLATTMIAVPHGEGFLINGIKKPCSLAHSMDLLTATVGVLNEGSGEMEPAVALVPASSSGIERKPFWNAAVLRAAESDEVILKDVEVPARLVLKHVEHDPEGRFYARGMLWFELMVTAAYLGVASALVERALSAGRLEAGARMRPLAEIELCGQALERQASRLPGDEDTEELLADLLLVRYATQDAISRVSAACLELLGGVAFISSPEVSYLLASAPALMFHPPSRERAAAGLDGYFAGEPLKLE